MPDGIGEEIDRCVWETIISDDIKDEAALPLEIAVTHILESSVAIWVGKTLWEQVVIERSQF
jgi:flagellar biosynthesis regulator FlaF